MTGVSNMSLFSAADAMLGYLYQVRAALLWSLRRLKNDPNFLVSIETLDDVAFEMTGGDTAQLLQTKHHHKGTASLTDACPDLWKTLRIWFEGHVSGQIPQNANLYLITTGIAPNNSAASRLRATDRDVAAAQQSLNATATTSTNETNKSAYDAYLGTTNTIRTSVLDKIIVIDAAPSIDDLDSELRQEVYWITLKEHHEAFLERLEGWWLRRVLCQLSNTNNNRISGVEIEEQMSDLREQFKRESLPIDDDLLEFTLDDATKIAHENTTFVKQLEIIKTGKRRIMAAIRDYYRAYEQRSRWLRNELIIGLELGRYDKHLIDEWELIFEAMCDDLEDTATSDAKEQAARSVLAWAECTTIPIRSNVIEPFVSRGSFHMLSDDVKIGWHPEFKELLTYFLRAKEGTK